MVVHTDASKVVMIVCLGASSVNSTTQASLAIVALFLPCEEKNKNKNETKQKT